MTFEELVVGNMGRRRADQKRVRCALVSDGAEARQLNLLRSQGGCLLQLLLKQRLQLLQHLLQQRHQLLLLSLLQQRELLLII